MMSRARRSVLSAALALAGATVFACSSANSECVPGDPACPGRTTPASDASTITVDAAVSVDGAASADAAHDACVFITEGGATRGCNPGSNGPGDRDDGGGLDAVAPPDVAADASNLPFMAPCDRNEQCASGICYDFVVKGYFCTKACIANSDCPSPSPGCSGQGFCRAPG